MKMAPGVRRWSTAGKLASALLVVILLGAAAGRCEAVAWEHSFIYFPLRELAGTPRSLGLAYEDVRFGPDGRLHGWFVPGDGPTTLLWLHGNGGNISHRLEWLRLFRTRLRSHVLLVDYQGYGLSRGQPSEQNTYQDARDALAYLRSRAGVDGDRIVYYGESLGGAVAVQLATEASPYRLVLQSTFTSLLDLARVHYPHLLPLSGFVRTRYATVEKIARVRAPLLVVHGEHDEIVPLAQARRLHDAAAEPKRLLVIPGARHNDLIAVGGSRYLEVLRDFCEAPKEVG